MVADFICGAVDSWPNPSGDNCQLEDLLADDGRGSRGVDPWQIRFRQLPDVLTLGPGCMGGDSRLPIGKDI